MYNCFSPLQQEPPPRSVAWRSPWGGGALFPDPQTGSCQECADRQLASDLAAARLRTHEVCPPAVKAPDARTGLLCVAYSLLWAGAGAAAAASALQWQLQWALVTSPTNMLCCPQPKLVDTEVSWGLLAAAALAAIAATALMSRRHLAAVWRGWRHRAPDTGAHPSASQLRSAAAAALRDATVSGAAVCRNWKADRHVLDVQ